MPGVKVLIKGANKVVEFPSGMTADEMQRAISKTVAGAGVLGAGALGSEDAEAGVISRGGRNLIEAWHGTPHNVDKFSLEKIGTGEGKQAFGRGLYFADAKEVAEGYREALAGKPEIAEMLDRYGVDDSVLAGFITEDIKKKGGDLSKVAENIEKLKYPDDDEWFVRNIDRAATLLRTRPELFDIPSPGNLYKAEIDIDPYTQMLDWDKPLSEQPEGVKTAFKQFADSEKGRAIAKDYYSYKEGNTLLDLPEFKDPQGETLHNLLGNADNQQLLKANGIKGIQYDDALSRGLKSGGTKNYVVFDDELIRIAEENGIPVEQAKEMINPQGGYADINLLAAMGGAGAAVGLAGLNTEKASAQTANQLMPSNNMLLSIDQLNKLPSHIRPDVGSIQGPIKGDSDVVAAIQDLGGLLSKFEVPVLGNPVQGLADYMQNFGYNDSEKERLKRAAMAVLDFL